MKAKSFAALLGLLSCAMPCAAQLVEVTVEPFVVHDGSIAELDGMTTYHVYAVCTNPSDEVSAIYGDATAPLSLTSTDGFYQNALGSNVGWTINPAFFPAFPAIEYDSWVTLGVMNQNEVTGQPNTVGMDVPFAEFAAGGDLIVNSENGSSWFTLFGDTQAQAGDDLKVLIAQLTAPNEAVITGNFNIQLFVNGSQSSSEQFEGIPFSSQEGAIFGCMDPDAVNYNPDATESGETCIYPCALELAISEVMSNTCPGVADGEVTVTSSGGQLGVLFGIEGNTPSFTVGAFDDLLGGTYTVTAVDGAGCEATIDVEVVDPAPIIISASMTASVSCNGGSDAVISGSSSGGTGAMSYSLSETFADSNADLYFGGLSPGLHTVYAMDENGCTSASFAISIANPQAHTVTVLGGQAAILDATCSDSEDGVVSLVTIGGSGTVASMQFSSNGVDFAPGNMLNLNPGIYTFYAMDMNGCISATANEYTVGGPPPVDWAIDLYPPACAGEEGAVYVSASGGNGGFTFLLDGEAYTGAFETFIGAGTFDVIATDAEGCLSETSFEIIEPAPIGWEIYAVEEPTCSNGFVGTMAMDAFGGTGGQYELYVAGVDFPFASSFEWTSGAGTYDFDLIDVNGCIAGGQYSLEGQPSMEDFEPIVEEPTCNGDADGNLQPDPDFDFTTWSVAWSGPTSGTTDVFDVIDGLAAGTYTLDLASAEYSDCVSTVEVEVGEPAAVEIEVDAAGPNCPDELTGLLFASAFETQGEVTWNVNGIAVSEGPSLSLYGLPAGTFAVGATDAAGCSAQAVAVLDAPEALEDVEAAIVQPTTFSNGAISLDAPAGTSVSWFDETGVEFATGNEVTGIGYGVYAAELTSAAGCTTTMEYTLNFPGCGLVDAPDWPEGSSGLYPEGEETWYLGLANYEEWVLRVPEVVTDAGVNFAVSHFELDTVSNLPEGLSSDSTAGSETDAQSGLCIPISGTPTEAGSYEVVVSGTMYIVIFGAQFPIPNYAFTKTILVEASEDPIEGCTYDWASNFNPFATIDDGSCEWAGGCTYESAENYDPEAGVDDGTCVFDFQPADDVCYFDFDDNGEVGATDLLTFLGAYASVCE